jgi:membrane protein
MRQWYRVLVRAGKFWIEDNAFKHAASVSFYTLFSLAPVMIIAVSLAGAFYGEEAAQGRLSQQLEQLIGSEGAEVVERTVAASQLEEGGWLSTVIGVGALVVGATVVFAQLQESLNQMWGVVAKPGRNGLVILLMRRLVSLAMVVTIGFLLLVSLLVTTALTIALEFASHHVVVPPLFLRATDVVLTLVVVTILFALVYKILPDVHLRWRDVWKGAFVTALLFSVGRIGISYYLGLTTLTSTYGAAGSLVAVLMWVYYSCLILFFGAEVTRSRREESGLAVLPKSSAVRVRRVIVEDENHTGVESVKTEKCDE